MEKELSININEEKNETDYLFYKNNDEYLKNIKQLVKLIQEDIKDPALAKQVESCVLNLISVIDIQNKLIESQNDHIKLLKNTFNNY